MKLIRPAALMLSAFASVAALTPCTYSQTLTLHQPSVPYASQLDQTMHDVLDTLEFVTGTPYYKLAPHDARQQFAAEDAAKMLARFTGKQLAPQPVASAIDMQIPGPDGTTLPVRVYTPEGTGPFPVVLYFHGGGFVIATIDTYDASARALANGAKAIVVSVEYRKAPEHPYPAAFDDASTSYEWLLNHAASLNGDVDRIAVAGESAGGNLATDVCLYARNTGLKAPVYQLLVYPVVSASLAYPSVSKYADAVPLGKAGLSYFYGYYVKPGTNTNSEYISPLLTNLKDLPPATVISAQIDPLQSEGEDYATKLKDSGVKTHYLLYTGVTHEFFGMGAVVAKAKAAEDAATADLRAAFAK